MKLKFINSAPKEFWNTIHPSGYRYDESGDIVPINKEENLVGKSISLKKMWLDINTLAIDDVQWKYHELIDKEDFSIDPNKRLSLVNEFGYLWLSHEYDEDEHPISDLSLYKEETKLYDFLLTFFHQYIYQGKKNNKQLFDLVGSKDKPSKNDIYGMKFDLTELYMSKHLSTKTFISDGKLFTRPEDLISEYMLYSLQTKLGEIIRCRNCGKNFVDDSQGKSAIYCSSRCRTAYYRRNKK